MAKMGRPTLYNQDIANEICEQIATSSRSLKTICSDEKLPKVSTVLLWLTNNKDFLEQYTRAKEQQADWLAEEMLDIADDGSNDFMTIVKGDKEYEVENKEVTNRSRLRVDTRKWIASKLKPKKYADRVDLTTGGEKLPTANIINLPTDALKQLEQIITNATSSDNQTDTSGHSQGIVQTPGL